MNQSRVILVLSAILAFIVLTSAAGFGHGFGHGGYGHGHDFKVQTKISHGDYHANQNRYKTHDPYGFEYGVYQSHPDGGNSKIDHHQKPKH
ncbi:Uncharacterised protein g1292 [Pycnogonum litorale]